MCFQRRDRRNIRTGVIEPWSNVCIFSAETVWNIRTGVIEPWSDVCIFNQKKHAEDRMEISYNMEHMTKICVYIHMPIFQSL